MNQEQPVAPPPNAGQYDFILNPQKPSKQGRGLFGGSFVMKLLLILGGAVVFMIVAAIVINIFFGSKTNLEDLVGLAQTQTEVVRISTEGSKVDDQALRNAAESARETVTSQQQSILAYLKNHGRQVKTKDLALKKNATTDKLLQTAQQANTYDTTYRQILRSQLEQYSNELKRASDHVGDPVAKNLLTTEYQDTAKLLQQITAK